MAAGEWDVEWLPGNGTLISIYGSLITGMKSSGIKNTATVPRTVKLRRSINVATGRSRGMSVNLTSSPQLNTR